MNETVLTSQTVGVAPRVSVIIPCYNTGRYLVQAIQSVFEQTYQDFEIIIVDDGSTDATCEVISQYNDPRVIYLFQENRGLPAARNTGIKASRGEYVAFLDADDWFLPTKLELQVEYLDEHPDVGLVSSGWIDVDEATGDNRTIEPWQSQPGFDIVGALIGVPVITNSVLARWEWIERIGYFDENIRYCEDHDLWVRLTAAGCTFAWVRQILSCYRHHTASMVNNFEKMNRGFFQVLDKFYARGHVPAEAQAAKDRVYASAYVRAAARAYIAEAGDIGLSAAMQALRLDPSLLKGSPCSLVEQLVGWADPFVTPKWEEYLKSLEKQLPRQVPSAWWHIRKARANQCMRQVFVSYPVGDEGTVRTYLKRALLLDPTWLLNWGVLVIVARVFIVNRTQRILRRKPLHI